MNEACGARSSRRITLSTYQGSERPYPVVLDREGDPKKALTDQESPGTLMELDRLRIVNFDFLSNPEEIEKRLEKQ